MTYRKGTLAGLAIPTVLLWSLFLRAESQQSTTLNAQPQNSPGSVAVQGADNLKISISPTTFQIQGPNVFQINPDQTWTWFTSNLTTLPDSFVVIAAPNGVPSSQATLIRPSISFFGSDFNPDVQGKFSIVPDSLSFGIASIQGNVFGSQIVENNLDLPVPTDQLPRINGQLRSVENNQLQLNAATTTSLPLRTILRFSGAPPIFLNAAGDGRLNFNITIQAVGSYPAPAPALPPTSAKDVF